MSNNQTMTVAELAACFRALSNPHRLKIFQDHLNCCPPGTRFGPNSSLLVNVGEITENMDLAPSTVSHHLKELRQAGLVRMERKGRQIECWIDPERIAELSLFFNGLQKENSCCTDTACIETEKDKS